MPIPFPIWILLSLIALAPPSEPADSSPFVFDHAWFAVAPGAMIERAALERAGLRFASGVNRHEGQGTAWTPPGATFDIITPRTDSLSPSFTILPRMMAVAEISPDHPGDAPRSSTLQQPLGLQRVTGVRLLVPSAMRESDALRIFRSTGAARVESGDAWCLELTFDDGARHKVLDLRATLPLVLRY